MVEIISRRDGPRAEDARLKYLIQNNRQTITRLADHLSQGQYSAGKAAKAAQAAQPAPERKARHFIVGGAETARETRPTVRATLNGRVVVVDDNSGRQLHHLGEIRRRDGVIQFLLATQENGFGAPLAPELRVDLDDLDAAELAPDGGEEALVAEVGRRLGFETS
jgi:hypothetical protein